MTTQIAIVLAVLPAAAQAQNCSDEIGLFAQQYGLSADLPQTQPNQAPPNSSGSRDISPDDLSRSGGVVAPSSNPHARIIEPNQDVDPKMSKSEAHPVGPQGGPADRSHLVAAKRAQMQGLLDAARAAGKRGDEKECLERLALARTIPEPG
jgi:hypothetical protein